MSELIFSRARRRLIRARAMAAPADSQWLLDRMAEELVDRLSFLTIDIRQALVFGHGAAQLRPHLSNSAAILRCDLAHGPGVDLVAEEDRLPIADGSQDLVLACGTLDNIDDLPGALILMRRALRPGGLFLGAIMGAGSLGQLRSQLQSAEAAVTGQMALRFHPQVDVRSAGDLLFRAGFSTPVADQEDITVNYSSWPRLRSDIRATGLSNALTTCQPLPRTVAHRLLAAARTDTWQEQFSPIYLTGWAPSAGEQRPAGPVKSIF
ncbi:MAG: class I SAM-dependent methyltransferase [Chakrabartia sp.]